MSSDAPFAEAPTQPDAFVTATEVDVVEPALIARLGAEVFGTFVLVLAIIGTGIYTAITGLGTLGGSLAGGIALLALIAAVGAVSGGHFNPAVTLGAAIGGRTRWVDVIPYWLAQFIGATLAGLVLWGTMPKAWGTLNQVADNHGVFTSNANTFGDLSAMAIATRETATPVETTMAMAIVIEVILTAIFVGVILGATDRRSNDKLAPVAIGLTLTLILALAAPFTRGSFNPARSFAAALFADNSELWGQLWVFLVAPLVGAAIAGLFYRAFATSPGYDDLLGEDRVTVVEETFAVSAAVPETADETAGTTAAGDDSRDPFAPKKPQDS